MAVVSSPSEDQLFRKTFSHPTVQSLWNTTTEYYAYAKSFNSLVKYGCEQLEANAAFGWKVVTPRIEPVLKSQAFKKYSQQADNLSSSTLDIIENTRKKASEQFEASRQGFSQIQHKTWRVAEAGLHQLENRLAPIDDYLKRSYIAFPVKKTLDLTEVVCYKLIVTEHPEKDTSVEGPIKRTQLLTYALQKEATKRIKDLSVRTGENIRGMKHYVSVLHSAIDAINQRIGYSVQSSVKTSQHLITSSASTASHISVRALATFGDVIDVLSDRIPVEGLKEQGHSLSKALHHSSLGEIGTQTLASFHEAGTRLTKYLRENETSREFLIYTSQKVYTAVDAILNILNIQKKQKLVEEDREDTEETHAHFHDEDAAHRKTNGAQKRKESKEENIDTSKHSNNRQPTEEYVPIEDFVSTFSGPETGPARLRM